MGYLIFQILFFLLLAALLGFVIGWLLRGARFQTELQDLDARWRSKLSDVEAERDRFAAEVTQANEARATFETSAAEAKKLANTHESSLKTLRQEHETRLSAFSNVEKQVNSLKSDLDGRDKELAAAKASLTAQTDGGDIDRLGRELGAATGRAETLERDLKAAKEANGTCKREVERLEARVAELQSAGGSAGTGGALGLTGPTGSSSTGGGALGLVGGTDTAQTSGSSGEGAAGSAGGSGSSSQSDPGYPQKAAAPSYLAETGGQGIDAGSGGAAASSDSGSTSSTATSSDEESEGVRPEGLTEAKGGVADDLKKISGVGPKLEKTLNGLGIFHFSQIAAFDADNVAWVDRHLRFKGRIERENWIEQAKILAAGGETEFSQRK